MFKCDGIGCTQVKDVKNNKVQTTCPSARCNTTCEVGGPDESCTTFVASQVEQIGARGPMTLTCNSEGAASGAGTECIVHEKLLDFYFEVRFSSFFHPSFPPSNKTHPPSLPPLPPFPQGVELADCHFGECVPAGARAQVAEGSLADFALRNAEIFLESTYILAAVFGVLVCVVICLGLGLYYAMSEYYSLGDCQALVADLAPVYLKPVPTTLTFSQVGYTLKNRTILKGISGVAPAGEILAIMGPSGCGKSTLMDILSMKAKSGKVSGQIFVNGAPLTETFKQCIGFVGQHDMLMSTLTVMESLMFSGLLRLPKRLTMKEKTQRVLAVLKELQLAHIADSTVGNEVTRGISGGEKRRVSVGMELVTSPRLLCLDEPTSGLDSYNADLLVQILMDLAQARKTAVVMVIHQPRANIFAKLDRLLLVCKGETVFSGAGRDVHPYFASIGRPIPSEFNAADYLIDILFTHNLEEEEEEGLQLAVEAEEGIHGKVGSDPIAGKIESGGWPSGAVVGAGGDVGEGGMAFTSLADLFAASSYAAQTQQEVKSQVKTPRSTTRQDSDGEGGMGMMTSRSRPFLLSKQSLSLRPVPRTEEEAKDEREARVGWLMEVSVVSQRMFKDMLRKPSLVVTHVLACVYFGCLLGLLYFQITTDGIAAIQNRMGIFMLEALFLAFTVRSWVGVRELSLWFLLLSFSLSLCLYCCHASSSKSSHLTLLSSLPPSLPLVRECSSPLLDRAPPLHA